MKRLVKKPRASLTTIGVFFSWATTKSSACASVASLVAATDHLHQRHLVGRREKCSPMKRAGRALAWASSEIGSAEVLLASTQVSGSTASSRRDLGLHRAVLEHRLDHHCRRRAAAS